MPIQFRFHGFFLQLLPFSHGLHCFPEEPCRDYLSVPEPFDVRLVVRSPNVNPDEEWNLRKTKQDK